MYFSLYSYRQSTFLMNLKLWNDFFGELIVKGCSSFDSDRSGSDITDLITSALWFSTLSKVHVPLHYPRILPFCCFPRCWTDILPHDARKWWHGVFHRSFCSSFSMVNIKKRHFIFYLINARSAVQMFYFCKSRLEKGTHVLKQ